LDAVRADFRAPEGGAWAAETYDLVVSNPPYIPTGALESLMPEVRDHDPREALDGGLDGLDAYRAIAGLASRVLRPGGILAMEIGEDQADGILRTFGRALGSSRVRVDLAGRHRIVVGTWRGGVA
jgi:release factor glutamine methyltransferase